MLHGLKIPAFDTKPNNGLKVLTTNEELLTIERIALVFQRFLKYFL